jgi:hypothetical protein
LNRINLVGRQALWCAMQIAVVAVIFNWASSPEMQEHGGSNPGAVAVFAVLMAAAATAAVMIFRDSVSFLWRWLVHGEARWTGGRLFGPRRQADQSNNGASRIEPGRGIGHPGKLPPGSGVRKQVR